MSQINRQYEDMLSDYDCSLEGLEREVIDAVKSLGTNELIKLAITGLKIDVMPILKKKNELDNFYMLHEEELVS